MIGPVTFRNALENSTLEEIIKEWDKLIREIRMYEKGNIHLDEITMGPSHEVIYMLNNL